MPQCNSSVLADVTISVSTDMTINRKRMNSALKLLGLLSLFCLLAFPAQAQNDDIMTESGEPLREAPLDDITERKISFEKRVLPYDHIREADIFWEKRIWRVIDTREKINLPFRYPERYFFSILMDAALDGEITVYSVEDDKFTNPLRPDELRNMISSVDTITTFDPETYEERIEVVQNDMNPDEIQRYRIKEVWFFDEETSTMQVRVLGIAPLLDVTDDNGNFLYEQPLFWVYYPEARSVLSRERAYTYGNDAAPVSWEDIFEMRFFSSYVYKESNVLNNRLQDYLSGVDLLIEADRIENEIFNFEHDLWSY